MFRSLALSAPHHVSRQKGAPDLSHSLLHLQQQACGLAVREAASNSLTDDAICALADSADLLIIADRFPDW